MKHHPIFLLIKGMLSLSAFATQYIDPSVPITLCVRSPDALLSVARTALAEVTDDIKKYFLRIERETGFDMRLRRGKRKGFTITLKAQEDDAKMKSVFNRMKIGRKGVIEATTKELESLSIRHNEAENEVIMLSTKYTFIWPIKSFSISFIQLFSFQKILITFSQLSQNLCDKERKKKLFLRNNLCFSINISLN